jgi:hypothetical protein
MSKATRIPPMIVCPYCGPQTVSYAGRVLSIPCAECTNLIHEHSGGTMTSAPVRMFKRSDDEAPEPAAE